MNVIERSPTKSMRNYNPRSHRTVLQQASDYMDLFKARITGMVVFTAWCGAFLAASANTPSALSWNILFSLLGIGMVASGTSAANQVIERRIDARMKRTARRPLVVGTIAVASAIAVTALMIVAGTILIAACGHRLAALLTFATSIAYIAVYTPLKTVTPLCTAIGAVPGAMPILLGWVVVRNQVDWYSMLLFAILFLWQFPHFHSISLLYADDYRRGGIRMLSVVDADGTSTRMRILVYSGMLVVVTLLPTLTHMSGRLFGVAAGILGVFLFLQSLQIWLTNFPPERIESKILARRMLINSVIYLPLLLGALVLDHAI